jgi:hypothetical protein
MAKKLRACHTKRPAQGLRSAFGDADAPAATRRWNDGMAKKRTTSVPYVQPYRYPSPDIPRTAICRFARRIAERFRPDKIILFGSYAYGISN